jgi:hypothetical protein
MANQKENLFRALVRKYYLLVLKIITINIIAQLSKGKYEKRILF